MRFDDDADQGEPSGPCAVAAVVLPSGRYVIDLVVADQITYRRILNKQVQNLDPFKESPPVETARVTRPVLPGDTLLVSVSYTKPDETKAGLYYWQQPITPVRILPAPATSELYPHHSAVVEAGYSVPSLEADDLVKCIDETIGERWFEPRDEACLADDGPCLEWVNATPPHTTWRFDGEPFRLTIEQAMGEHVGDQQEAAAALDSLATPLVHITTHQREPGRLRATSDRALPAMRRPDRLIRRRPGRGGT